MLYLSLEMVSITSYVMVAYMKGDRMSNEASLKYVLFGAVSTGAMLYGLSLLYGMTGTTEPPGDPRAFLARGPARPRTAFAVYADRAPGLRGLRLQDRGRALPLLVPRRLPGRAHAGDRVPLGGAQGRGLRGDAALLLPAASSTPGGGALGPRGHHRLAALADAGLGRSP